MDISRSVKRLALIVILGIFVILRSKSLLRKAVENMGIEIEKKQQAKALRAPATLPAPTPIIAASSSAAAFRLD